MCIRDRVKSPYTIEHKKKLPIWPFIFIPVAVVLLFIIIYVIVSTINKAPVAVSYTHLVIHGLVSKDIAHNIKAAKRLIDNQDPVVWDIVEAVSYTHLLQYLSLMLELLKLLLSKLLKKLLV